MPSETVNYSTLFGEYKSPSLSFDPFKLYDEQVGQKNAGENVIGNALTVVKYNVTGVNGFLPFPLNS